MPEGFVSLKCANCGAKLDVYPDMERFACGYCGTELIAQRRGGTVALRAVTEAIKQVQIGTDKTAAELALLRHEKELDELVKRRNKAQSNESANYATGCGCGAMLLLGGVLVLTGGNQQGWLVFALGAVMVWGSQKLHKSRASGTDAMTEQIGHLQSLIAEKKTIVNGP